MSPKFKEINGFVFKIYSNEEKRMHIHVVKAENEAKYWLEPNIELSSERNPNSTTDIISAGIRAIITSSIMLLVVSTERL